MLQLEGPESFNGFRQVEEVSQPQSAGSEEDSMEVS